MKAIRTPLTLTLPPQILLFVTPDPLLFELFKLIEKFVRDSRHGKMFTTVNKKVSLQWVCLGFGFDKIDPNFALHFRAGGGQVK